MLFSPILVTNRAVHQKEGGLPNFAKSQMLPSREVGGQSMAGDFGASRKATALVHPRVAALQAGDQKKPSKFTIYLGHSFIEMKRSDSPIWRRL
jgi:hypothetical protein